MEEKNEWTDGWMEWKEEKKDERMDGWFIHLIGTAKDLLSHIWDFHFPIAELLKVKVQGLFVFCFVLFSREALCSSSILLSQFWEKQSKSFGPHMMDKEIET